MLSKNELWIALNGGARAMLKEPYFANDPDVNEDDYIGFGPGNDFNREIVHPGDPKFPGGAIGIRIDDDFWVVGVLPYMYLNKTTEEIVQTFWSEVTNPTYNPDTKSSSVPVIPLESP